MMHTLTGKDERELSIIKNGKVVSIFINNEDFHLSTEDLNDLIGILLHVQAKMRKS